MVLEEFLLVVLTTVSLIQYSYSAKPIDNEFDCNVRYEKDVFPLCSKKFNTMIPSCLFMKNEHKNMSERCSQGVQNEKNKLKLCNWGDENNRMECEINTRKCSAKELNELVTTQNSMNCIPYHHFYQSAYPPRAAAMRHLEHLHCSQKKWEASNRNVYQMVFNCWLFDCEDRLKIPFESSKNQNWPRACYPPKLIDWKKAKEIEWDENVEEFNETRYSYIEQTPEFCPLYTVDINQQLYTVKDGKNAKGCVLAPLCGLMRNSISTIDDTLFLIPLVNGVKNETYCEILCSKQVNYMGKLVSGHPCRRRPSCEENGRNYNHFQIPQDRQSEEVCLPWCDHLTSLLKDKYLSDSPDSLSACNWRPLCNEDGSVPPIYGPDNPFASEYCLNTTCDKVDTEKYNCWNGNAQKEDKMSLLKVFEDADSTTKIIFIVGGVLIVILIISMVVFCVIWLRGRGKKLGKEEALQARSLKIRDEESNRNPQFVKTPIETQSLEYEEYGGVSRK